VTGTSHIEADLASQLCAQKVFGMAQLIQLGLGGQNRKIKWGMRKHTQNSDPSEAPFTTA
jgi:hypothetical protein